MLDPELEEECSGGKGEGYEEEYEKEGKGELVLERII